MCEGKKHKTVVTINGIYIVPNSCQQTKEAELMHTGVVTMENVYDIVSTVSKVTDEIE